MCWFATRSPCGFVDGLQDSSCLHNNQHTHVGSWCATLWLPVQPRGPMLLRCICWGLQCELRQLPMLSIQAELLTTGVRVAAGPPTFGSAAGVIHGASYVRFSALNHCESRGMCIESTRSTRTEEAASSSESRGVRHCGQNVRNIDNRHVFWYKVAHGWLQSSSASMPSQPPMDMLCSRY
jgi:hypothetical protein